MVLWLLLTYGDDPEEALVNAVMADRDADTIAAMLGNLLGARHGTEAAQPARWQGENLEDHDGWSRWRTCCTTALELLTREQQSAK